jgi:hypothetical protein
VGVIRLVILVAREVIVPQVIGQDQDDVGPFGQVAALTTYQDGDQQDGR